MKTVAANRYAGCGLTQARLGFALYVNDWNTANRQLRLMWSDGTRNGCEAVESADEAVPYGRWTHVGFTIRPNGSGTAGDHRADVKIYVDGRAVGGRDNVVRPPQAERPSGFGFRVGAHADDEHGFIGNISDVAVLRGFHPQVMDAKGAGLTARTEGLLALYRLLDTPAQLRRARLWRISRRRRARTRSTRSRISGRAPCTRTEGVRT